ncbi:MAG TPA: TQO small subunit DoxD [Propionibacteriaceae bacterium]|jgi:thiosulfate dehydrogenase (quinone) large subunit|nr:TQO small subunit DoxD [Propionibacteriaceae bacterium]
MSISVKRKDPTEQATGAPVMGRRSLALLRIAIGFLWIQNADWKNPPSFEALLHFTKYAVDYPVFPPYAWIVEHVVLANFAFFGWGVLLLEAALGGFLLVGLATRFWALLGIAQTIAISLSVLYAPNEWHWSYFLMLLAHIVIVGTAAGRYAGIDGVLRPSWQASSSRVPRILLRAS